MKSLLFTIHFHSLFFAWHSVLLRVAIIYVALSMQFCLVIDTHYLGLNDAFKGNWTKEREFIWFDLILLCLLLKHTRSNRGRALHKIRWTKEWLTEDFACVSVLLLFHSCFVSFVSQFLFNFFTVLKVFGLLFTNTRIIRLMRTKFVKCPVQFHCHRVFCRCI